MSEVGASSKYWRKRFEILEKRANLKSQSHIKSMEKQYAAAKKTTEQELAVLYNRLAGNNGLPSIGEAKKLLTKNELKDFHMTLQEYTAIAKENGITGDWTQHLENASLKYRISRLEAMKIQLEQQANILMAKETNAIEKSVKEAFENSYYGAGFEIAKGTSVGKTLFRIDDKTINTVIHKPWAADGKNFSERVWGQHRPQLVKSLHTKLTSAIMRGEGPDKAIKEITGAFDVSMSSAARLVQTEEAYFSSVAQRQCFNDLDVEKYEIIATLDGHTSDICQNLDGKVYKMDEFEAGVTAPPFHPRCRTTTAPYFPDEVSTRAARNPDTGNTEQVPSNMTYQQWRNEYVKDPEAWKAKHAKKESEAKAKAKADAEAKLKSEQEAAAEKAAKKAAAIEKMKSTKAANVAKKKELQNEISELNGKQYDGIWYNQTVTPADYAAKKDSIAAKKSFYDQKISDGVDVEKHTKLKAKLEEFEKNGKLYEAVQVELAKLTPKPKAKKVNLNDPNAYSQVRKDAAYWFTYKNGGAKAADKVLRENSGKVWRGATTAQKEAAYDYTKFKGSEGFNRPLSGFEKPLAERGSGWEEKWFKGNGSVWIDFEGKGKKIRDLTDLIAKSSYDFDVWVNRGCGTNAIESFLKLKRGTLSGMTEKQLQQFVGKSNTIDSFVSTGIAKGKGVDGKVKMNIYIPKGTQCLYAEPFSAYGASKKGLDWDGISKQSSIGDEAEMIIQRGAYYKITKIEKSGGTIYIDVEVHPERGYNTFQQDGKWTGSTKNYKD